MPDQIIATVQKNKTEEIRIAALSEFRGHHLANLWVFHRTGDGDLRPDKAGLAIRLEKLPAVIEALQSTVAEAHRLGLLK